MFNILLLLIMLVKAFLIMHVIGGFVSFQFIVILSLCTKSVFIYYISSYCQNHCKRHVLCYNYASSTQKTFLMLRSLNIYLWEREPNSPLLKLIIKENRGFFIIFKNNLRICLLSLVLSTLM